MDKTVGEILDLAKNLASSNIMPIIESLIYQQASIHAPDLVYVRGEMRNKRGQEHTFIHSYGGLGIDTAYSICKPFFVKHVWKNKFTSGSLTALNNALTQEIDRTIAFFPELNAAKVDTVSLVKSIAEECMIGISKDVTKGMVASGKEYITHPGFVISCNYIPKSFDNAFLSRFDNVYQLKSSYDVWDEISKKQTETIATYNEMMKVIGKKADVSIADYRKVFLALEKEANKQKYYVVFDDILKDFEKFRIKMLQKVKDEKLRVIFSRDTEIGLRRINTSAWMNHSERRIVKGKKARFIFANDDDLKIGIDSFSKSIYNKDSLFGFITNLKKEKSGFKKDAFACFKEHYDEICKLSFRKQSDFMKKQGFDISHVTCEEWGGKIG